VTFTIAKRFAFSASHVLHAVPEHHKCRRLHGHNYEVEVLCSSADLDDRGMVVDYFELDPVKVLIDERLDHRHLNDVLDGEPTAERLAWWIHEALKAEVPIEVASRITAVRVHETPRTWAEYRPG
jgi:6-pyruvoyltetrahydropterin/6-carboxytetrahydropterin synthase